MRVDDAGKGEEGIVGREKGKGEGGRMRRRLPLLLESSLVQPRWQSALVFRRCLERRRKLVNVEAVLTAAGFFTVVVLIGAVGKGRGRISWRSGERTVAGHTQVMVHRLEGRREVVGERELPAPVFEKEKDGGKNVSIVVVGSGKARKGTYSTLHRTRLRKG
jgi:hypothetical protein